MKKILFLLFLFFLTSPVLAFAETITVSVEGMTCDSCAQAIEGKLLALKEKVESAKASFDSKQVVIELKKDEELDDPELKQSIEMLGYRVSSITRNK